MFNLAITKKSKIYFIISAVIMVICIAGILINGLNFGIDFKGGTIIQLDLGQTFETKDISEITDKYDKECKITVAGDDGHEVIINSQVDFSEAKKVELLKDFADKFKIDPDKALLSFSKISATIGEDLQRQSITASIITVICILIYITIRFEFLFGIASIIALLHDLIVVIGVYAIFKIPVNSPFIAALLTILGYSINNTIVVFDRIRENRRKFGRYDFGDLVDTSVNQTMLRSINTTITTMLAVGALFVFGVESIREFTLPMIVGFISGLYTSVFVAGNFWFVIKQNRYEKGKK